MTESWEFEQRTLEGRKLNDYAITASGYCIAVVSQEDHARLIAAAPELLEALRKIAEACEARDYRDPLSHADLAMIAHAAIAKAERRTEEGGADGQPRRAAFEPDNVI